MAPPLYSRTHTGTCHHRHPLLHIAPAPCLYTFSIHVHTGTRHTMPLLPHLQPGNAALPVCWGMQRRWRNLSRGAGRRHTTPARCWPVHEGEGCALPSPFMQTCGNRPQVQVLLRTSREGGGCMSHLRVPPLHHPRPTTHNCFCADGCAVVTPTPPPSCSCRPSPGGLHTTPMPPQRGCKGGSSSVRTHPPVLMRTLFCAHGKWGVGGKGGRGRAQGRREGGWAWQGQGTWQGCGKGHSKRRGVTRGREAARGGA